jgi:hypothetical protein
VDSNTLRKLIVEWIVDRRHAFNEVEAASFRKIVEYLDVVAVSKLPKKGDTIRAETTKYFEEAKLLITEILSTSRSMLHLSFDIWTSSNYKHMIAITAHWTSVEYTIKTSLLAIREVQGKHSGENISETVYDVAKEYNIVDRLGYFMMDGAGNNNTAIVHLNRRIRRDGGIGFNPVERRLRCFGHIQNRVVRKLLFGKKVKQLEAEEEEEDKDISTPEVDEDMDIDDEVMVEAEHSVWIEDESNEHWRAIGAVGKVHNIVKFIRMTPQRRSTFLDHQLRELQQQRAFMVRADNDTRWNSTWNMIDSVLAQRQRIDGYCSLESELAKDRLTPRDWADLEEIMELLEPFKYLTMLGQEKGSDLGSIGTVLPGMDMLLEILEKARGKPRPKDAAFQEAVDASWQLLTKYYKLTDKSPVYIASVVLDPRMKYEYFERAWKKDWIRPAKRIIASLYQKYKIPEDAPMSDNTVLLQEKDKKKFDINAWRFGKADKGADELTRYLNAPILKLSGTAADGFDLLEWWRGNDKEYSTLARIAMDIFSIPAMSVEPERVFSGYTSITCD